MQLAQRDCELEDGGVLVVGWLNDPRKTDSARERRREIPWEERLGSSWSA